MVDDPIPEFSEDEFNRWAAATKADIPLAKDFNIDAWFEDQLGTTLTGAARRRMIQRMAEQGVAMLRAHRFDTFRFRLEGGTVVAATHWEQDVRNAVLAVARRAGQTRDDGPTLVEVFRQIADYAEAADMIAETSVPNQIIFRPRPMLF